MEENYINELDKEYKKSRWLRGGSGREARDMSGSSHSSDSHGVYSAYSYTGTQYCAEYVLNLSNVVKNIKLEMIDD